MASTIHDQRAKDSLLEAIRSGQGARVAKETCALLSAKKDALVKKICQECCASCSPEYCMYMVEFLTRKTKTGKNDLIRESEWIADGIATIVAGVRGDHARISDQQQVASSLSGTPERKHARIRQMVGAVESAAKRIGMSAETRIGAREDPRFAKSLLTLPARLDQKWNGVLALIDMAYRHNVPQVPLTINSRFRELVCEAKGGVASTGETRRHEPSALRHSPSARHGGGSSTRGRAPPVLRVADDSQLKLATLWTFDRASIPCHAPDDVRVDDAPENTPEKVVHCSVDGKRGGKRSTKRNDSVTCVLVDETV